MSLMMDIIIRLQSHLSSYRQAKLNAICWRSTNIHDTRNSPLVLWAWGHNSIMDFLPGLSVMMLKDLFSRYFYTGRGLAFSSIKFDGSTYM